MQYESHTLNLDTLGPIVDLRPETAADTALTPDTRVLCCHRGREVYHDTFDSRHYAINPGMFQVEYGAAKHFQARAVVPGSRNPETRFQASFIAILGIPAPDGRSIIRAVDDRNSWEPFTDDECREYGHAVEALDRAALVDPIDPEVKIVEVRGQRGAGGSRVKGEGGGVRTLKTRIEGSGAESLKGKRTVSIDGRGVDAEGDEAGA